MLIKKLSIRMSVLAALSVTACTDISAIGNPFSRGSSTLHLDAHPKKSSAVIQRSGQPVVLLLGAVVDGRDDSTTHTIGKVTSSIVDMSGDSLKLDEDVASVVFNGLKNQLVADGFQVISDSGAPHDFELTLVAKNFRLDIVERDNLNISADLNLRAHSGDILWAGSVAEKSSRFAGVSGDSRVTVIDYLNKGLAAWAVKASAMVRDSLLRSYPQTMALSEHAERATVIMSGIKTQQDIKPREAVVVPKLTAAAEPILAVAPIATHQGLFSVTTTPPRAKVYVDDIYYGSTPLKLEFDQGIVLFRFKLEGYKTVSEKVSIRRGETTELDIKFEK